MPELKAMSLMKMTAALLLGVLLIAGMTACGKRGDPYRPSEVTTTSS